MSVVIARATRGRIAGSAALARATEGRIDVAATPAPPPVPDMNTSPPFQHAHDFKIRAAFKTRAEFPDFMKRLRSPGSGWRTK